MNLYIMEYIIFISIIIFLIYIIIWRFVNPLDNDVKDDNINEGLTLNSNNIFKKFNGKVKISYPGSYKQITYRYHNMTSYTKQICYNYIKPIFDIINKTKLKYKIIDYLYFNSKKYKDGYITTIYFTINEIGSNETQLVNFEVAGDINNFYHINYLINNNYEHDTKVLNIKDISHYKDTIEPFDYRCRST